MSGTGVRTRRRPGPGTVALVGAVLVCGLAVYLSFDRTDTSRHAGPSHLGPACGISIVVAPVGKNYEDPTTVLASTAGGPTDVLGHVVEVGASGSAVVSIVIGRPGSKAGTGAEDLLPRDSVARRENQLATGKLHNPRAGDAVHASYDFTEQGHYPVFYTYTGPADARCSDAGSVTMMARLGVVDVHT